MESSGRQHGLGGEHTRGPERRSWLPLWRRTRMNGDCYLNSVQRQSRKFRSRDGAATHIALLYESPLPHFFRGSVYTSIGLAYSLFRLAFWRCFISPSSYGKSV